MPSSPKSKYRKRHGLPQKVCPVCGKAFSWRKKWRNTWEEVKYCSERCRRNRKVSGSGD